MTSARARATRTERRGIATTILREAAVAALALGVRGTGVATALVLGVPAWLALLAGIALTSLGDALGRACCAVSGARAAPSDAMEWTRAATGMALYAVLLRALCVAAVPAMPQEAYYWNYAIHPDFGYHDHPPLVAWLIGAGEAVAGHGMVGVRLAAFACGLATMFFTWRFALRLTDRTAAMMAAALAGVLPFFFFLAGLLMTPDVPLTAAWAAALYALHRALVGGESRAWLGVGVAMGLGMLSKYTVALLVPAAVLFCLADRRARTWLARPQPWLAALIALVLFTPVIYWNSIHEWASFRFQTGERFGADVRFSLHRLLLNMLVVATPLPLLALPLLRARRWTAPAQDATTPARDVTEPAHADARNRLFVACFLLVPLAVFAWSALRHLPRLNWTGPLWLAVLPLLGWAIVNGRSTPPTRTGRALRALAMPMLVGLLVVYALVSYHVALGFPGVRYPRGAAPMLGWTEAARALDGVARDVERTTGTVPVLVGMDAYQIASQIAFHSAPPYLTGAVPRDRTVTAVGALFGGEGLMFSYWHPPATLRGRTMILVARHRDELSDPKLAAHFRTLEPAIAELALVHATPGGERTRIDTLFYRTGIGYEP